MYEGQAENLLTNEEKRRSQQIKIDYLRDYCLTYIEEGQKIDGEGVYIMMKEIWDVAYSYGFDDGFEKCLKGTKNDR